MPATGFVPPPASADGVPGLPVFAKATELAALTGLATAGADSGLPPASPVFTTGGSVTVKILLELEAACVAVAPAAAVTVQVPAEVNVIVGVVSSAIEQRAFPGAVTEYVTNPEPLLVAGAKRDGLALLSTDRTGAQVITCGAKVTS